MDSEAQHYRYGYVLGGHFLPVMERQQAQVLFGPAPTGWTWKWVRQQARLSSPHKAPRLRLWMRLHASLGHGMISLQHINTASFGDCVSGRPSSQTQFIGDFRTLNPNPDIQPRGTTTWEDGCRPD